MKNTLFGLLIMASVSCSTNDDFSRGTPESTAYFFQENRRIQLNTQENSSFTTIENGDNLVFTYRFQAAQQDLIADDEYSETVVFEVDPSLDSFSFTDDELIAQNVYFDTSCFCEQQSTQVANGTISGTKVSTTQWDITVAIDFERFNQIENRSNSGNYMLIE